MTTVRTRRNPTQTHPELALALIAAGWSLQTFSTYVPDYLAIHDAAADQERLAHVRAGYLPATAISLLIGGGASLLIGSWLPLAASAGASLGMAATYEAALPEAVRLSPLAALLATLRERQALPIGPTAPAPTLPARASIL